MISLLATIDPQWFLFDVFLFSVATLVIGIFLFRLLRPNAERVSYPFERISTEGFMIYDLLAVGLVVALFSSNVWLPLIIDTSALASEQANSDTPEMAKVITLAILSLAQFVFPCVILLAILSFRINILKALGITRFNAGVVALTVIVGIIAAYASLIILTLSGYESVMHSIFGKTPDQAAVQAFKDAKSPAMTALLVITAVIIAPIGEEIIFRTFLYTATKKFTGMIFAVITSSLLFSVVHGSAAAFFPLFIVGVILALAYEISGSIWASILIHALFNLISVVMMMGTK